MFEVGEKVVYPLHGAGIIEAIEEKEVLGEKQKYYIMRIPNGSMKVMIPLNSEVGLRQVVDESTIDEVLAVLQGQTSKMSSNWNKRYRENMEKIRSGDIFEVAEVVRNLAARDHEKGLSTGERKMLESAKQILFSEISLIKGLSMQEIEEYVASIFRD